MEYRLKHATSHVQSIQNARCAVNKLSPEILASIFCMVEQPFGDTPAYILAMPLVCPGLVVSAVCRYWRESALATPTLWSTIRLNETTGNTRIAAASDFLDRSSQAPLKVYYQPSSYSVWPKDSQLLESLSSQVSRFEEFHVRCTDDVPANMWDLCHSPAPLLKTLSVSWWDLRWDIGPNNVNTLPQLFAGHVPKLERLFLRHFSPWSLNQFKGLTHLTLFQKARAFDISLPQFLDVLRLSPHLVELVLVSTGPTVATATLNPDPGVDCVVLKSLERIELGSWDSARDVAVFLSYLDISPNVGTSAWGFWKTSHWDDTRRSNLSSLFRPSSHIWAQLVHMRAVYMLSTRSVSQHGTHILQIQDGTLRIQGAFEPIDYMCIFLGASGNHALDNVHTLWYAQMRNTVSATEIFRSLPSLTTLVLETAADVHSLHDLLCLFDDDDSVPLLFPNLTTIRAKCAEQYSLLILSTFVQILTQRRGPTLPLEIIMGNDIPTGVYGDDILHMPRSSLDVTWSKATDRDGERFNRDDFQARLLADNPRILYR